MSVSSVIVKIKSRLRCEYYSLRKLKFFWGLCFYFTVAYCTRFPLKTESFFGALCGKVAVEVTSKE